MPDLIGLLALMVRFLLKLAELRNDTKRDVRVAFSGEGFKLKLHYKSRSKPKRN
ncbi:MAG: hypothetical protein KF779_11850 [Hyphomonadaceae bacterium]|nr:hypothetical protein [Hyphomonadaceae bacterium]